MGKFAELFPKAVELFRQGRTCVDVSREFGVSTSTAAVLGTAALLRDPSLPTPCGRSIYEKIVRVFGPDPVSAVRELLREKTWREIATMLGYRSPKSVSTPFNLLGVTSPRRGRMREPRAWTLSREEVERVVAETGSCRKAAGVLGIPESTFYKVMRRLGVPCRANIGAAWVRWFRALVKRTVEALERTGGYTMNGIAFLHHANVLRHIESSRRLGTVRRFLVEASRAEPRLRWMYVRVLGTQKYGSLLKRLEKCYIIWLTGSEERVAREIVEAVERVPWRTLKAVLEDNGAPPELVEAAKRVHSEKG
jgi:predicted DNA-binding transcriptional regulator AlpA